MRMPSLRNCQFPSEGAKAIVEGTERCDLNRRLP